MSTLRKAPLRDGLDDEILTAGKEMPLSTLTSKGQLTLPQAIRTLLNVQAGDTVDFVVEPDGTVAVRAGRSDVSALRGLLFKPGREPVSLEAMEEAVRSARRGAL